MSENYYVSTEFFQELLKALELSPLPLGGDMVYITRSGKTLYVEDKKAKTVWQIDTKEKLRSHKGMGKGCFWTEWEDA